MRWRRGAGLAAVLAVVVALTPACSDRDPQAAGDGRTSGLIFQDPDSTTTAPAVPDGSGDGGSGGGVPSGGSGSDPSGSGGGGSTPPRGSG
ncbi:MAG TPA: hypothetical protein VM618_03690, partial [Acidimicrobiia bacterium]|nr:hypothetical protein [Acidimicrobiia bacterium]